MHQFQKSCISLCIDLPDQRGSCNTKTWVLTSWTLIFKQGSLSHAARLPFTRKTEIPRENAVAISFTWLSE